MAFNTRHHDNSGEVSRKHGNTLIRTLGKTYGEGFAGSWSNKKKLADVFHKLDEPSLTRLVEDYEAGKLDTICRERLVA